MKINRGFTLIELLVVISIISLLSSIVLAALQSARAKGRVAAGQLFSTHTFNAFGADAEGVWNFNETSGTNVPDYTTYHLGTLSGNPLPTWDTDTPSGKNRSLRFVSGGYVAFANNFPLPVTITITAWIKTSSAGTVIFSNRDNGGTLFFGMGGGKLWVYDCVASPVSMSYSDCPNSVAVNDNTWHNIAYSANGSVSKFYVDGKIDCTLNRTSVSDPVSIAELGHDTASGQSLTGLLDDVTVYTQSLAAKDIEAIYVQGLAEHFYAVNNIAFMEIIPAILPKDFAELEDKLAMIKGIAPVVQIDICDGEFVPSETWPYKKEDDNFRDIVAQKVGMPFWEDIDYEIDLMVNNPYELITDWLSIGARRIILHVESAPDLMPAINELKNLVEIGLAINTTTSISIVEPYIDYMILYNAWVSKKSVSKGKVLMRESSLKLDTSQEKYPNMMVSVDGGVAVIQFVT